MGNRTVNTKKALIIGVLTLTVILTGVAVFTAVKLYKIGVEPSPTPKPAAKKEATPPPPEIYQQVEEGVCELTFDVAGPQCVEDAEITVTPQNGTTEIVAHASIGYTNVELRITTTSGTTPYQNPTVSGNYDWTWTIDTPFSEITSVEFYVSVASAVGDELCGSWAPSPTPTPSPSPSPPPALLGCWSECTSDDECIEVNEDYRCQEVNDVDRCVNPSCPTEDDCTCPLASPSPSPSPSPYYTPSPSPVTPLQPAVPTPPTAAVASPVPTPSPPAELPEAGILSPTLIFSIGGLVLVLLGLLL